MAVPLLTYSCMFQVKICSPQWLLIMTSWRKVLVRWLPITTSWRKDKQSWGKHAHIPDNDYWGICLFHSCEPIFFLQLFLCGTHGIYIYFPSTEHCAWTIISPIEFKSCVTRIHLHYCTGKQNYLLSNILQFALKICFWADF